MTNPDIIRKQKVFGFSFSNDFSLDNFISGRNSRELDILRHSLDDLINAGDQQIFLTGASGSGTTHLLKASCQYVNDNGFITAYISISRTGNQLATIYEFIDQFDLVALDDLDTIANDSQMERMLFELFNLAADQRCTLLFAAKQSPKYLSITLPDLHTRLLSCLLLHIEPLAGDDVSAYVSRLFTAHRIQADPGVINYILTHYNRSCNHLQRMVALLEQESLRLQRPITRAFVRSCLDNTEKAPKL